MNINFDLTNKTTFVPHYSEPKRDAANQAPTWKDKIQKVPLIGHLIRAIIWLFNKIFPCCFKRPSNVIAQSPILTVKTGPVSTQKIPPVVKEKKTTIESLLNLPHEVRIIVLKKLSQRDLEAFYVALSSPKTTDVNYKKLHEAVKQILRVVTLENACESILVRNPTWRSDVNNWTTISLEDKVWLLRMNELKPYVNIPSKFLNSNNPTGILAQRKNIEKFLETVTSLNLKNKSLKECPDFLYLLPNLESLDLSENDLTIAPDLRKNITLKNLILDYNKLTLPPNVSHNKQLKRLRIANNELTQAPDVSGNEKLRNLDLSHNCITSLPSNTHLQKLSLAHNLLSGSLNFSTFKHLCYLDLNHNNLTTPPIISNNVALEVLRINLNQLTLPPDVSSNLNLRELDLSCNGLKGTVNVTNNHYLRILCLESNPLMTSPDVSQNKYLENLNLSGTLLTQAPNVDKNIHLKILELERNQITQAPNIDRNLLLEKLCLDQNQITQAPNIKKNAKLCLLSIRDNPLTDVSKEQLFLGGGRTGGVSLTLAID